MRVDFQADDFGATSTVTANIMAALQDGGLTGVSVLANGDAVEEAASAARSSLERPPRLAVHLNLSEGRPLLGATEVPDLVDGRGRFRYGFCGLWASWLGSTTQRQRRLLDQVAAEWSAQIGLVQEAFAPLKVSGVDGHIHIHMLPFLFPLAAELARRARIPEIRISDEVRKVRAAQLTSLTVARNLGKAAILTSLSRHARRTARRMGLVGPERVAGISHSGRMDVGTLLAAIAAARDRNLKWLEVICHPGRADPREIGRWGRQRWLSRFYLDPRRDTEREALIAVVSHLHHASERVLTHGPEGAPRSPRRL